MRIANHTIIKNNFTGAPYYYRGTPVNLAEALTRSLMHVEALQEVKQGTDGITIDITPKEKKASEKLYEAERTISEMLIKVQAQRQKQEPQATVPTLPSPPQDAIRKLDIKG